MKKQSIIFLLVLVALMSFFVGTAYAQSRQITIAYEDENIIIYDDNGPGGSWGINKAGGIAFACPCGVNCSQLTSSISQNSNTQTVSDVNVDEDFIPNGPNTNGPSGPNTNGPNGR